jgi:hypothetical protein
MGLKTYDYIITLKPTRSYAAFDWISLFLILIALTKIALLAVSTADGALRIKAIIFGILILGSTVYSWINKGPYRVPLFLAFISCIFILHEYFIAILYAICGILEKQVKFKRELGFDEEGVTINTFPKKRHKWHEINNVLLKDGILTLDLYNNRILQKELEDESTEELEKEFNEFCRAHLLSV